MPFWLLMILAPHWRWTRRIVDSPWIVAPAAVLYVVLVAPVALAVLPLLANPDLASIAALLGSESGATIAWVHFLTFDLFVGRWIYLDSRDRDISAWISSPNLALTLMFGPAGLLVYLVIRLVPRPALRTTLELSGGAA
jgi:hypothetical protein